MSIESATHRYSYYGLVLGVLGYGSLLTRLASGHDFLNSYPFVGADGFDWLYEGLFVYERLRGYCAPHLWLLRDPGFVLVCALDMALRAHGLVVIFTHTLSFLVTGLVLLRAATWYSVPPVVAAAVTSMTLLHPLNYVRLFILADPMAVAFLTLSTYAMLRHLRTLSIPALALSGVFALIGGLTQIYAAIPFIIGIVVSGAAHTYAKRHVSQICVTFVAFGALLIALQLAWRAAVPHEVLPKRFGFLEPSLGMTGFYATVWTVAYVPLLPAAAAALWSWFRSGRAFHTEAFFLGATAVTYAILTFFYQWAEVRFTFIYQPIVLLLLIVLCARGAPTLSMKKPRQWHLVNAGAVCSAVLVAVSVALMPLAYYGTPRITASPRSSWLVDAWRVRPVDRFGLGASPSATMYSQATMPAFGPYAARIVRSYLTLRTRQEDRRSGVNEETTRISPSATEAGCREE